MNKYPTISIAIGVLNEEKRIEQCLNSLFAQKYKGTLDIMILDGGSTDATVFLAKKFPVRVLKNPKKTAEYAEKIGLEEAQGDYFMILGCDMEVVGDHWFEQIIYPLEKDKRIVGSWCTYMYFPSDPPVTQFVTFDPIQRDPLFVFLTPSISSCVVKKYKAYWELEYHSHRILPSGFCIYRIQDLRRPSIMNRQKYMELDNLVLLVEEGCTHFAYVPHIGFHHPFLSSLKDAVKKRQRNLESMYFDQPDKRTWTWIEWDNPWHIIKLFLWVLYCYTIIPCVCVGFYKCLKHRSWIGMYEVPFNFITTSVIIIVFVKHFIKKYARS